MKPFIFIKYRSAAITAALAVVAIFAMAATRRMGAIKKIEKKDKIEWLTIDKAISLSKKTPKKIYVDIYTDWCGWCKKMDQTSFTDPKVIETINTYYYPVKFDAESKDDVNFNDKLYHFSTEYRSNELAVALLNGQMGYPSAVILDQNQKKITQVPGYQDATTLVEILAYFGKDIHLTTSWEDYLKEIGKKSMN